MSDSVDWSNAQSYSGGGGYNDDFGGGEQDDFDIKEADEDGIGTREVITKDCVLFLVDCHKSMLRKNEEGVSHLQNVLKLIGNAIRKKIISTPSDLVGVAFYGTRMSKNESNEPGLYMLFPPVEPSAQMVKDMEGFGDNMKNFFTTIGCEDVDDKDSKHTLFEALWGTSMTMNVDTKKCSKRILLFTSNPDPTFGDKSLRQQILKKGSDMEDLGISLDLFGLETPGSTFDGGIFFQDLLQYDDDMDLSAGFSSKIDDMKERMSSKINKKRSLATVEFELGHGASIGVKLYCPIRPATKDAPCTLHSTDNQPLKTITTWVCPTTGTVLKDYEMIKFYPYGGEKVVFTDDEMKTIKTFGPPGLELMGFKPMSRLKVYYNIKAPYFVYPDDESIGGSSAGFQALLVQMSKTQKFAIARLIVRKAGVPRFVALVPQMEVFDANGQVQPSGMHMVFLPYADEIRKPPFEETQVAEVDLIVKAKQVIRALSVPEFNPDVFRNPGLQKYYSMLHALALNEQVPQETEDVVQPDEVGMERHAALIENFVNGFKDIQGPEEKKAGQKRKAKAAPEDTKSKKAKAEGGDGDASGGGAGGGNEEADMMAMIESGTIGKLTIPQLKEFCRNHKLVLSGKKR